jgi:hypothetical protein
MDLETYGQIELATDWIGERAAFLQDGMKVTLQMHGSRPVSIRLPPYYLEDRRSQSRRARPNRRLFLQAGVARKRSARTRAGIYRQRRKDRRRNVRSHLYAAGGLDGQVTAIP